LKTPEVASRMENAELVDDMHIQRDWSYIYDRFSGDGYIAVGTRPVSSTRCSRLVSTLRC
jgi:hypothetical protein